VSASTDADIPSSASSRRRMEAWIRRWDAVRQANMRERFQHTNEVWGTIIQASVRTPAALSSPWFSGPSWWRWPLPMVRSTVFSFELFFAMSPAVAGCLVPWSAALLWTLAHRLGHDHVAGSAIMRKRKNWWGEALQVAAVVAA